MRAWLISAATLSAAAAAQADFVSGFEAPAYSASAAGTVLTGQNGWTLPAGVDSLAYTYAGNSLGIAANPTGGDQFAAGTSPGGALVASRAQHPNDFSAGGVWTAAWDIAAKYNGTLPSANNLGSFSLQPSASARFWQTLYNWVDNNTAQAWNCAFLPFNASGVQAAQPGLLPDPAFGNLAANHWYRVSVTWDFGSNQITSTSITDLTTSSTTTVSPVGWYLTGGTNPTALLPTDFRFFAGGQAGNVVAFDNVSIVPAPGVLALAGLGLLAAGRRRR